jgi:hypothetical protein
MTDYEIRDLASTMTANIIEMTSIQGSYIAIYLSVVFAFIAASYVAGRDLNKLQTTVSTLLFCVVCAWLVNRITAIGLGINFLIELNNENNITKILEGRDMSPANQASIARVLVTGGVWSLGMLGALVFLWDVRHRRVQ